MLLDEFLRVNRELILSRVQARVAARDSPQPSDTQLKNGIPVFLDQLGDALRLARLSDEIDHEQLGQSAGRHGHDLLLLGLSIGQVVHDYGDVCQSITALAGEQNVRIATDEFRTLNLCLDDAIAGAVSAYARQSDHTIKLKGTERLGFLAHEMRNLLTSAMLSFEIIKSGQVAPSGSTAQVHGRSLLGLRELIDRTLADVRLDAGIEHLEMISVAEMVEEIEVAAVLQAHGRGLTLMVSSVDRTVTVEGDRQVIAAAVANLLQNAFKFTRKDSVVSLTVHATAERVFFDVEDECGGLPAGKTEDLFRCFTQSGTDRGGLGLGLAICRKAAEASAGELHVRNLPGKGCVFTLDLPRKPPPPLAVVGDPKRDETTRGGEPDGDESFMATLKAQAG